MTEKVLDMKERSRDDWGVDDVTLNIGSKPSRATISMPHDGTEPPETPQAIKVVCDENTVFQGTLVSSSEKAVGKLPELIATYADARAKLAKIPTPARRRHSDGETVLTPNEPLVFNRDGEFDRNPSTELRFGGPLDECVCWSFWDVLNYLVEYGFSDSPASELVSFDTSEIDGFCKSRLFTLLARNFDISEKSLADALNSLLSFAGLSWRVEFDAPLPYITVFPLRAFGDGRTFDAGVVRGVVDINEPPDITEFETTAHNTPLPSSVKVVGAKRAVELTLFTKKKYVDGELSDCELFEGDLRPAWSQEEQNTYEVIYILDPFCRNQALESVRKSLSHVYRLYEINPDFRIGQFFESEGDSEPYVVEAITRDAVGRPTPYEISVLREEDGKWDMLSDERRRLIGCMSSQNGQLLEFSRPVSVTASADPRVTKAHELGYTVCIADNTLETETVEGSSYLPAAEATGPELVVRVDGYAVRKVLADTVHVRFTEADGGERDDREAMREQARAVYDALGSSNRARLRLMGLVSDLKAGQLLESVTFDNGFDGLWRSPLELKAIAKVVRLRAHDNSTKVEVL